MVMAIDIPKVPAWKRTHVPNRPRRVRPGEVVHLPPIGEREWWVSYSAQIKSFIVREGQVSWKAIRAFATQQHFPLKHVPDVVAFLDIEKQIHRVAEDWCPGPPEEV